MAPPITGYLDDMFAQTVTVTHVIHDGFGNETLGVTFDLACHINGKSRLIRNRTGQEVVSTFKIIVPGDNGLTVDDHLYTLPDEYDQPRPNRKAIAVKVSRDENAAIHHVSVMLP